MCLMVKAAGLPHIFIVAQVLVGKGWGVQKAYVLQRLHVLEVQLLIY